MRAPSAGELLVGAPSSVARVDPKPAPFLERARTLLDPLVDGLVRAGISADTVTAANLVFGLVAAGFAAFGSFGPAAVALGIGSVGDALDGSIARATKTASPKGAIFDASVDRYQEFAYLAGVVIFFRTDVAMLALTMAAILGSFMVSYGSAKAEALRLPVPPSPMRRAGRAIAIVVGTGLVPVAGALVERGYLPAALKLAPLVFAVGLVAVVSNVSAVVRLRSLALEAAKREP